MMETSLPHHQQQQHQQQQPNTKSVAHLDHMNREKVASILSYLDEVDNESCCSSIAPASFVNQQQHQHQQHQYRDDLNNNNNNDQQAWSPSPSNPEHYQHQQNHHQQKHHKHHVDPSANSRSNSRSQSSYQHPAAVEATSSQNLLLPSNSVSAARSYRSVRSISQNNNNNMNNMNNNNIETMSTYESSIISGTMTSQNAAYGGLRRKVSAIVAERDAASRQVETLKQSLAVAEDRERARVTQVREQVEEEGQKSRKHLQAAVDEHLRCIRKLLSEKEGMMKKVELLQAEVATATTKREAEMKRLRELHDKSLHDLRSRLAASERAKRDEWSQKEAKRIKESTMKAMEPDIALLLNRHKAEKKRLEEELAEAGKKKEQLAAAKEREMTEFKNRLVREMDETNQRERESFRTQMQEQTDRLMRSLEEEKKLQEERRAHLERNHEEVRNSLVGQVTDMAKKLADAERRQQQRECNSASETASAVATAQAEMAEQHRQMREALEKERASLASSVQEASEQLLEARTTEIRKQCQMERDAAISKVVQRLEKEQLKVINENRESEKRWKDVNGQLQRETDRLRTELECSSAHLRSAREALTARDNRIRELQEQVVNVKHVSTSDTAASEESFERRLTALDNTWQQRLQNVQAEHVRETSSLQAEVQHLKRQQELMKEEYQTTSSVAAQKHSAELVVINERVTLTMNKKEAQLRQLSDTISALERQLQLRDEELARHDALLAEE